jgi:hypothetical protein
MKLLIGLKNAGFLGWIFVPLKEKLKKSKLYQNATKLEPTDNAMANTGYTCRC